MPRRNMAEKIDKNMIERKEQHKKETPKSRVQKTESNNKTTASAADSRIDRDYQAGFMPSAHQKVLAGFVQAVGGVGKEGEINLQRQVLDQINMSRSSVLRVIPFLVKYGYIRYEARPLRHCSYVSIIKGV